MGVDDAGLVWGGLTPVDFVCDRRTWFEFVLLRGRLGTRGRRSDRSEQSERSERCERSERVGEASDASEASEWGDGVGRRGCLPASSRWGTSDPLGPHPLALGLGAAGPGQPRGCR